jgi:hypothetical protein
MKHPRSLFSAGYWAGALGGRLYELVTIGATLLSLAYLYGVYSAIKRGVDVTHNAISFSRMQENVASTQKELLGQAEQYRQRAGAEPDLLRAARMRQLAEEADSMRQELARLANDLKKAEIEYKKAETVNTFLNAFGGDTGAVLAPVLDQVFELKPPGESASLSVSDYFDKKLGAPIDRALAGELTTRIFQLTLERAFRECGVTSTNVELATDCVGTELMLLSNKLGAYGGRSDATDKVRDLIKRSLSNAELRRLLRNRLEHGDFGISDGGAPEEDPGGMEDGGLEDAGSADGGRPETWPGRWSGVMKVAISIGETHTDTRQPIEVNVAQRGAQVIVTSRGGPGGQRPLIMTISPSNPNVASGQDKNQSSFAAGMVSGKAEIEVKSVAFLREGRLYLTFRGSGYGEGHAGEVTKHDNVVMSIIGMLDRVE